MDVIGIPSGGVLPVVCDDVVHDGCTRRIRFDINAGGVIALECVAYNDSVR